MGSILGFSNDFTEAEYAAIGRLVRAFTEFEHALAATAISFCGGDDAADADPNLEKKFISVVSGTMEGRLKSFLTSYREKYPENAEFDRFEASARALIEWRNAILHGRWSRAENGSMKNVFYQRNYVLEKKNPPERELSVKDINALAQQPLACIQALRDLRR